MLQHSSKQKVPYSLSVTQKPWKTTQWIRKIYLALSVDRKFMICSWKVNFHVMLFLETILYAHDYSLRQTLKTHFGHWLMHRIRWTVVKWKQYPKHYRLIWTTMANQNEIEIHCWFRVLFTEPIFFFAWNVLWLHCTIIVFGNPMLINGQNHAHFTFHSQN